MYTQATESNSNFAYIEESSQVVGAGERTTLPKKKGCG